ncbi:MAG TPA: pyrimidine reductase family protein [Acidimicrobiales bacterium]|nr:pyrimidine reductase family protein [Acidimicrobiales bacterium]
MRLLEAAPREVEPIEAYGRLRRLGPRRPGLRLNMIAAVDGAAAVEGRSGALGGPADKTLFGLLRSLADVILVGAGTVRTEGYGPVRLDDDARSRREEWGLPSVPPIAVVTRACRLDWESPFFTEAEQPPLIVTVASAPAADRERAASVADVIVAGDTEVDFREVVGALAALGHDNVLAEGGPAVAAELAAAGLLDEVCLTLSPLLTAGDAHRILYGAPLAPPVSLSLVHVLEADGYLFLRYRRK